MKVTIKIDRLAPLGERSGGVRSTSSILAERFISGQCRPLTADLADVAFDRVDLQKAGGALVVALDGCVGDPTMMLSRDTIPVSSWGGGLRFIGAPVAETRP